jgi:hypothetical protein
LPSNCLIAPFSRQFHQKSTRLVFLRSSHMRTEYSQYRVYCHYCRQPLSVFLWLHSHNSQYCHQCKEPL